MMKEQYLYLKYLKVNNMAELTLTSWMDPIFAYFATESGIPLADYSAMAGGEAIGSSIEVISDLTLQPLATKIIGALIGAASVGYGVWGKPSMRLRKELVALGHHMLTRILDPTPSDIIDLRKNINDLLRGLRLGNMSIVTSALLRSPAELGQMIKALGGPVQNAPPLTPPVIPRIPAIPG
ncbi:unnamed protein product, partial [marine sediment metagenome]